MAVKNIECQIAEMQIGRYVSGEPLSSEALKQLETHVTKCSACSRVLADRRTALKSMLKQGFAAVTTDVPKSKENALLEALKAKSAAVETPTPRPAAQPAITAAKATQKWKVRTMLGLNSAPSDEKKSNAKPLIYCGALAAVLFGMTYFSKSQDSVFGGSADRSFPEKATTQKAAPTPAPAPAPKTNDLKTVPSPPETTTPVATPPAGATSTAPQQQSEKSPVTNLPQGSSAPAQAEAKPDAASAPAEDTTVAAAPQDNTDEVPVITHRPVHHRHKEPKAQKHTVRHAAKQHAPANTVRVYDESGNPLGK